MQKNKNIQEEGNFFFPAVDLQLFVDYDAWSTRSLLTKNRTQFGMYSVVQAFINDFYLESLVIS